MSADYAERKIPDNAELISWQGEQVYAIKNRWILSPAQTASSFWSSQTSDTVRTVLDRAPVATASQGGWLQDVDDLGYGFFSITTRPDVSLQSVQLALASGSYLQGTLQPDFVQWASAIPNDPNYSQLYGLNNTGQTGGVADADIDAAEAWDLTRGSSSIVVGVIDTGVDYTHPDLTANIWTNPGEVAGDGIDNDGNGFVDDIHGYDFVNDDGDPMDDNDHGTHCSGTIGAVGNNGVGVVGVNWNVKIMGLKFLSGDGFGSDSGAIAAINYATMMKMRGVNLKLTSNSWGGGGFNTALRDAIQNNANAGMLFVAAAGNDGENNDTTPNYPSNYDVSNIIAVAATNSSDGLASFSNYGLTQVDIGAPGVGILSTTPGNTYSSFSGTSMATPHVAGVAALAWSVDPNATFQKVRSAVVDGGDTVASLVGKSVTGKRLNALGTLNLMGLNVVSTTPAAGSSITTQPTSFVVDFSSPITANTLDATDLLVNGIAATSVVLTDPDTATFTYAATPVTVQGLQTMTLAAGSVTRLSDGVALGAYSGQFRYDLVPLQVAATSPVGGGVALLPLTTITVDFNEPVLAGSLGNNDLSISQGTVTGFTALDNDTVQYTVSGVVNEGQLTFSIAAGNVTDPFGNPNSAFSGTVTLDVSTAPLSPLVRVAPFGSMIYTANTSGFIGVVGDTDNFTLDIEAGQVLSVIVVPSASGLRPAVQVTGPNVDTSATASIAGGNAAINTISIVSSGTYTIAISGAASTVGQYTIRTALNAAGETESYLSSGANNTMATAQVIEGSSITLPGGATRLAVVGRTEPPAEGSPATTVSTDVPKAILDMATITSVLNVGTHTIVGDLEVRVNLTHTWDGDLRISLISPSNTSVMLVNRRGGSGDNFTNTDFDDEAATAITSGSAPFTGRYRPEQSLSAFDGQDSFGTWTLRVEDAADIDIGTLLSWSITVRTAIPSPDVYAFNLTAGQDVAIQLSTTAPTTGIELLDDTGATVAMGTTGPTNTSVAIAGRMISTSGLYYARVNGTSAADYSLIVERGATFDLEANDSLSSPQPFGGMSTVLGCIAPGSDQDIYSVMLSAGQQIQILSSTPGDGVGLFNNTLDPTIELYDSANQLVGSDNNSAADGRNAVLSFTAPAAGLYKVRMFAADASSGEYVLRVTGSGGGPVSVLQITGTMLPDVLLVQFTSPTSFYTVLNGVAQSYVTSEFNQIQFDGLSGLDTVLFYNAPGVDTASLNIGGFNSQGVGYSMMASNVEFNYLFGDALDTATFADSSGNDYFYGLPGNAILVSPSSTGFNQAVGFGAGVWNTSGGTGDMAVLYDIPGVADTMTASSLVATINGVGSSYTVRNVDNVYIFGSGDSGDRVTMQDASGDDVFYGLPYYSILASNTFSYFIETIFVPSVIVTSSSGFDQAVMFDSDGNDTLLLDKSRAQMSGQTSTGYAYSLRANAFDAFFANSSSSGNDFDSAIVDDSAGNDVLVGFFYASIILDNGAADAVAGSLSGFNRVTANSSHGGNDYYGKYSNLTPPYEVVLGGPWTQFNLGTI